jgi:hypothetical protein
MKSTARQQIDEHLSADFSSCWAIPVRIFSRREPITLRDIAMRVPRCARSLIGMIAVTTLSSTGCGREGSAPSREAVSGTVSFDGQPLKKGTIQFQPASQADGALAVGPITDGHFDIPGNEGPAPGKYGVAVYNQNDSAPAPGEMPGPVKAKKTTGALIPARYNTKTELTAEVEPGGPNSYAFDLKK